MEQVKLITRVRRGEKASRVRRRGCIPGIMYGPEVGNVAVEVEARAFERVVSEAGTLLGVVLEENGGRREYLGLLKEVQYHPVTGKIIHFDIYQVPPREKIRAEVPLVLVGVAQGTKEGGILEQELEAVEVECLPQDLPEQIEIDISPLKIGDVVTVADLPDLPGVRYVEKGDRVIITILAARPEEEVEEGVETEGTEE